MKDTFYKIFSLLILQIFSITAINALNTAGGHRGNITALIYKKNIIISAGEDGFIVIWNVSQRAASVRFQLTTYRIQSIVSHPQKDEICIIESGGLNNYRISAWNYSLRQRLFSVYSAEPVGFINYSAGGNFIIASGLNNTPVSLLDSITGQVISVPAIPPGNVSFATTGKSERSMLVYQSEHDDYHERSGYSGQIIYYDIDSLAVTGSFQAPGNLLNPVTFGNNRFIAGINSDGLLLVDAASGEIFDTIASMDRNVLLCPTDDGFYTLRQRGTSAALNRYSVDRNGKLISRQELSLSLGSSGPVSVIAYNGSLVFASSQGNILLLDRQNRISQAECHFQTRITEIAIGDKTIAFLTENGDLSFLPLDYRLVQLSASFTMTQRYGYTRITPVSVLGEDRFILWQTDNTRKAPQLLSLNQQTDPGDLAFLLGRFPLLSISVLNDRLLVLDTGGNITVRSTNSLSSSNLSSRVDFTFSSVGAIDGALINNEYFIVSRSVINDNSPFIFVNIRTSETVPVSYPAQAGLTVFAGSSGNAYAEAVERDNDGIKTTVVVLPPVSSAGSRTGSAVRLFEYRGEASLFSMAESQGNLAIACGSNGAIIFADNIVNMERTNGLPVKLFGYDRFFISLDSEGNIAWYDNRTGSLLALFSLSGNIWTLSAARETSGEFSRP